MKPALYSFISTLAAALMVALAHAYVQVQVIDSRVTTLEEVFKTLQGF